MKIKSRKKNARKALMAKPARKIAVIGAVSERERMGEFRYAMLKNRGITTHSFGD